MTQHRPGTLYRSVDPGADGRSLWNGKPTWRAITQRVYKLLASQEIKIADLYESSNLGVCVVRVPRRSRARPAIPSGSTNVAYQPPEEWGPVSELATWEWRASLAYGTKSSDWKQSVLPGRNLTSVR